MQSKSVLDGAPRKLIALDHAAPPQQEGAVPATGQNTLRLPKCVLSAPSQRKPLESHDLVTTARVHHTARRRGGVAAGGAGAATRADATHRRAEADDSENQARMAAFLQGLAQLGWTDGRNVRIETGHDQCRRPSQTRGIKRRPHQAKALGHLDLAIQFASPDTANSATAPRLGLAGADFLRLRCPIIDQRSNGASQSRSCAK